MSLIRPADCIGCQLRASGHKERFTETKRARGQPSEQTPTQRAQANKICSCQSASQFVCLDGIICPQKATEQHCHSTISIPTGDGDRVHESCTINISDRNYNSLVLFREHAAWKDLATRSHNTRLLSVTYVYCTRSVCVWTSCRVSTWALLLAVKINITLLMRKSPVAFTSTMQNRSELKRVEGRLDDQI